MKKYIKKVREKSENERKRLLFVWMAISMSLVVLVWFYSLGHRFNERVSEKAREDIKPFKMLGNSLSGTIKDVESQLGKISSGN